LDLKDLLDLKEKPDLLDLAAKKEILVPLALLEHKDL